MSPTTLELVDYWRALPTASVAERRRMLASTIRAVRTGVRPASALVPFVLGDPDTELVRAAAQAHLATADGAGRERAVADAIDWVRRDLPVNRCAVLVALFELGSAPIDQRLGSLRLLFSGAETERLCRELQARAPDRACAFLGDWRNLVADSTDPVLRAQRIALQAALGTAERTAAAA